jgi:hypothetical protein
MILGINKDRLVEVPPQNPRPKYFIIWTENKVFDKETKQFKVTSYTAEVCYSKDGATQTLAFLEAADEVNLKEEVTRFVLRRNPNSAAN